MARASCTIRVGLCPLFVRPTILSPTRTHLCRQLFSTQRPEPSRVPPFHGQFYKHIAFALGFTTTVFAISELDTKPAKSSQLTSTLCSPGVFYTGQLVLANVLVMVLNKNIRLYSSLGRLLTHYPPDRRYVTYLTSLFAHADWGHLVQNMVPLALMAPWLINEQVGPARFLALFLSGGVWSTVASVLPQVLSRGPYYPALGASGAAFSVLGCTLVLVNLS
jgi:hypothetical protein